jgi:deferrochelatase/peroxidase EfeB
MADQHMLSDRDRRDIQGLVLFGTTCPLLRYHFFHVNDAVGGRRFVHTLIEQGSSLHVNSAGHRDTDTRSEKLVYVGFTARGLQALAVPAPTLLSFPEEFRQGPKARATDLGDIGESGPDHWSFDPDAVHIAVMLYARHQHTMDALSAELVDGAVTNGMALVSMLDGEALPDYTHHSGQHLTKPVHFGYSDGLSQPDILPAPKRHPAAPPAVPPGMFVLGHPDSPQDGEALAVANQPVPIPTLLLHNGTFGAFRVMEQDVDGYEDFLDRNSVDAASRELLAAKMCGRWRNGLPLSLSPTTPEPTPPIPREQFNAFDYRPTPTTPTAVPDRDGHICPAGSHVRRSNPRSSEVLGGMGNRLRLIRRGMPYGPVHDPAHKRDGKPRGMLGLFLCVSLKDQFEFIMRHWVNDGLFARGLAQSENDPMVGAHVSGAAFTYRGGSGATVSTTGLSRFVKTRGAAYLFFPSITGLRFISALPEQHQTDRQKEAVDEAVDMIVQSMTRALGNGTTRDAHPKHHGLVKATVTIDVDAVPPHLRHGLFATSASYKAYVRFSNGRPTPTLPPDAAPDVRGMAIKLFGVQGPKELADEKYTHDFVMASHPVFFVPDVFGYVDFLQLPTLKEKMRLFPDLAKSFRSFESPLTIRYFSQTPYALGPHVVKYMAMPVDPAEQPPIMLTPEQMAARAPNYLREAMAAHLTRRPATFALCVQTAPDAAAGQVDDASRLWDSDAVRVATITIEVQDFRRPAQDALAETISMSPWHCLPDHRPLGTVNLARRRVYREASVLRHANRAVPVREPDGETDFEEVRT